MAIIVFLIAVALSSLILWAVIHNSGSRDVFERMTEMAEQDQPIKIWLDDERPAPEGWLRFYIPSEVIFALRNYPVHAVSLDHDLGFTEEGVEMNGYEVMRHLEEEAFAGRTVPPIIDIHTANPVARERMEAARDQVRKFERENRGVSHFHVDRNSEV